MTFHGLGGFRDGEMLASNQREENQASCGLILFPVGLKSLARWSKAPRRHIHGSQARAIAVEREEKSGKKKNSATDVTDEEKTRTPYFAAAKLEHFGVVAHKLRAVTRVNGRAAHLRREGQPR